MKTTAKIPPVGSLVFFAHPDIVEFERLFEDPFKLDPNFDTFIHWYPKDGPGIILNVKNTDYSPYSRVQIIAGEKIGWCYTDYVESLT